MIPVASCSPSKPAVAFAETPEEFLEKLLAFWKAQNKTYIAPRMYKAPVSPHKLWHEVMSYGGYEAVSPERPALQSMK